MAEVADRRTVAVTVNGEPLEREVRTHRTLVEFLRRELELTGTTEGCGVGVCGCCTVLVDGEPVNACLELAVNVDGATVTTIEGLRTPDGLGPVQAAFREEGGFQCGYCTPGMIVMTTGLLATHPDPDGSTVEAYLSENLCRCTGYASITRAVDNAAARTDGD